MTFVEITNSINVVGNIWEPRKFTRYLLPNDKIDAYAIA